MKLTGKRLGEALLGFQKSGGRHVAVGLRMRKALNACQSLSYLLEVVHQRNISQPAFCQPTSVFSFLDTVDGDGVGDGLHQTRCSAGYQNLEPNRQLQYVGEKKVLRTDAASKRNFLL